MSSRNRSNASRKKTRRHQLPASSVGSKRRSPVVAAEPDETLLGPAQLKLGPVHVIGLIGLLAAFLYAYWPTLTWIEDAWRNEPDYSHGYLVLPLALVLCWTRWETFPGFRTRLSWLGLSLIVLGIAMRIASRFVYADFLDAWSMLPMIAGIVWLLTGPAATRWALPAIAFLFLMIPLPFRAESLLSWKLQGIATELSTVLLRVFGQPAVSEGHVIWIGDERLMVEEACSGLRIFVGVAALAFFWAAATKRAWIDRVVLLVATLPLAVLVNSMRITTVGIIYSLFDSVESRHFVHDLSGYLMIPVAFGMLFLLKAYWQRLYRPVEQLTARQLVVGSSRM